MNQIFPLDGRAGTLRTPKRMFKPMGEIDLLIAAHAKFMNFTLVSNNTREFERIEGLRLENWV